MALGPRQRRLMNEYEKVREVFDGNPYISVDPLGVVPPERYRVTFELPSLRLDNKQQPVVSNTTVVDIELPMTYPKDKPHLVAHGNVFHPNFGDYVCIADFWSPSQSLVDIIIDVGLMLQWQKYNIQSPLNAIAADWAVKNSQQLPVGKVDFMQSSAPLDLTILSTQHEERS